jgi:hypothetical protein
MTILFKILLGVALGFAVLVIGGTVRNRLSASRPRKLSLPPTNPSNKL